MTNDSKTNDPLDAIKARAAKAREGRRNYSGETEAESAMLALLAEQSSYDVPKLVAALEAVETLLAEKYKLYAAICGETCVKDIVGVDHEAIADNIVANIRATIAEALA